MVDDLKMALRREAQLKGELDTVRGAWKEAKAEIARLTAERDRADEDLGKVIMALPSGSDMRILGAVEGVRKLRAERDDAKAEIARIETRDREIMEGWLARCEKAEAEIARLEKEHQDFRLQNDREWRAKLDHANAEIARLRDLVEDALAYMHNPFEPDNQSAVYKRILAALKPDTGE